MTDADIIVKEGRLYRFGTDGGLIGAMKRKTWKPCYGVLTRDATLTLYKDHLLTSKVVDLNLDASVLWLAFGKEAVKYGPPLFDADVGSVLKQETLIAVPKDKTREAVTWLAADDRKSLQSWISSVASTVESKYKPPVLGHKRGDYAQIMEKLVARFDLDEKTARKWEIYWLNGVDGDDDDALDIPKVELSTQKVDTLKRNSSNLTEGTLNEKTVDGIQDGNGYYKPTRFVSKLQIDVIQT